MKRTKYPTAVLFFLHFKIIVVQMKPQGIMDRGILSSADGNTLVRRLNTEPQRQASSQAESSSTSDG